MTCPRCTHEIEAQDAVEFIVGQKAHILQTCFDFAHADLGVRTTALAELSATVGALQQAAKTARIAEAQAIADMLDIQAQVDQVNAIKAASAAKDAQIAQSRADLAAAQQVLAAAQLQLAQTQSNILTFAKENADLKTQIDVLKAPKP